MSPVVQAATLAAGRSAFGATATGDALFTAATQAAGRSALGSGAVGDALFTAANQTAGRSALGVNSAALDNANGSVAAFIQYQLAKPKLYDLPRTLASQLDLTNNLIPDVVVSGNVTWTSAETRFRGVWVNSGAFTITLPVVGNGAGQDPVGTVRYIRCRVNPANTCTFKDAAAVTIATVAGGGGGLTNWLRLRAVGASWVVDYQGAGIVYSKDNTTWKFSGFSAFVAAGGGYPDNLFNRVPTSRDGGEVVFKTTSKEFFLFHKDIGSNWRIMVNGAYAGAWNNANTGGLWYRFFSFPDATEKEIRITGGGSRYFGELVCLDGGISSVDTIPTYKVAFLTDSIGEGADYSYPYTFGRLMNFNAIASPEGGSGFIQTGNRGTNFIGRIAADIYPEAPNEIYVQGGRNDFASSDAAFQAAIETLCDSINANLPGAVKVLVAPFSSSDAENVILAPRGEIMRAVAAAKGFYYIDWIYWIKGTNSVQNSGNAPKYINAAPDIHPNNLGRAYLGARLAWERMRVVTGELCTVE
jgi:hypothetical protein